MARINQSASSYGLASWMRPHVVQTLIRCNFYSLHDIPFPYSQVLALILFVTNAISYICKGDITMSLNTTPAAERIHIGIFGKRNAGKSSLINAITSQELAIVSEQKGTTTDPVLRLWSFCPSAP